MREARRVMRSDEFWLSSICREEMCPRLDVHPAHEVDSNASIRIEVRKRRGTASALPSVVLDHIESRRCKRFGEVYEEVLHDFGTVTMRSVHRTLAVMVRHGQVVHVVPQFMSCKRYGAYLRADSPLLYAPRSDLDEAIDNAWESYPYER